MTSQSLVNVPDSAKSAATADADKPPAIKQSSRVARHLAQAVQLEEGGTSPLIRFTMLTAGGACMAFVLWAALTTVEEVAVAEGEVVPVGAVQTVQHFEGGLVEEILVKEGDLVQADQPLIRLSAAQAMGDLDQTRAREITLLLKSERLRAFVEGRKPDFSFSGKGYEHLVADNLSIYQAQMQARETARAIILSQIEQKRSDLRLLEAQHVSLRQQADALREELKIRDHLVAKGLVTKIAHLDTKRETARAEGELARILGQTVTAREALAEMERRLLDNQSTLQKQSMDELGVTIAELAQVQESVARLEDRVNRLMVTSPVHGYVKGLTVHNPGSVIQPGGLVSEVVPVDNGLRIDAKIQPRDVGHVKLGQKVKIKVSTYDFARYGSIMGELTRVSASSFLNEKGEPYFKAAVKIEKTYVGDEPGVHVLRPGMTVQAEVMTGDKTLLQYMLKPIFTQIRQSFHER
ncbi:HlyD family type I secretion periplasmic adaptor subunit [Magnetospirillum sp. UT-4]|uniref:HlyD family type I secretion periplasmic adaptor subunit n=1 Tax=Magnetospirillum sp. UT-4 TaxID=2681467 RepID=UPI001384E11D|nr:HlyD family type I secretion periplasmic adaptor subunit [Magnetospirillum sp. UT-4]CAA7616065.1 Type I secretion membrane fusion protein, HlyD [Magnetospirillum sp. UT-4]